MGKEKVNKSHDENQDNNKNPTDVKSPVKKVKSNKSYCQKPRIIIPKRVQVKKRNSNIDEDGVDDLYTEHERKVYEKVLRKITSDFDEKLERMKSTVVTREEITERIVISGRQNKDIFRQQLSTLPQLVESVVEQFGNEILCRNKQRVETVLDEIERNSRKYSKHDFILTVLNVVENINFETIIQDFTNIHYIRYLYCIYYILIIN